MLINKKFILSLAFLTIALHSVTGVSCPFKNEPPQAKLSHNKHLIKVINPWSPQMPPSASVRAGYFAIFNQSELPLELTEVSSPYFGEIEIHRSMMEEGLMSMAAVDKVTIDSQQNFEFSPGGFHLMMRDHEGNKSKQESWPITLHFSDGQALSFVMPIKKPTAN